MKHPVLPWVTTIITSFNKGPYLAEAVDSALRQDYGSQEVLVIDDGSTDNTRQMAESFGHRVRYVYQDNRGQSNAKNRGIALARGDYIAFLDGDDRWREGKLARQMARMTEHPEVAVVYGRAIAFDHLRGLLPEKGPSGNLPRGRVLDHLMMCNFIPFSSAVVRRACLSTVGGFDEGLRVAEDYDLWLRLAKDHLFDYVDDTLLDYRVGIDQIGSRFPDQLTPAIAVTRRFVDRFYAGHYPRPRVVRQGMAAKYAARGDVLLGQGRHAGALWAHARSLAWDPFRRAAYLALLRDLFPNHYIAGLRSLAKGSPAPERAGRR
jgi:glycosyltransferase involved in cell wall biosynthesis